MSSNVVRMDLSDSGPKSPRSPPRRRSSAASPTMAKAVPTGFRAPPKLHERPLHTLDARELEDRYAMNEHILAAPSSSQSTYITRMEAEQLQIKARLQELGVRTLGQQLDNVHIADRSSSPVQMIGAKRRALELWNEAHSSVSNSLLLPAEEALEIEQKAHQAQLEREKHNWEKRSQTGRIMPGEQLSQKEMNDRLWAFMNYKPTDSDEEEMDEDQYSDDGKYDGADEESWFDDYDEDQGQPLIEPDELDSFIRVDEAGQYPVMKIEH